jgi:hypothetical protein
MSFAKLAELGISKSEPQPFSLRHNRKLAKRFCKVSIREAFLEHTIFPVNIIITKPKTG